MNGRQVSIMRQTAILPGAVDGEAEDEEGEGKEDDAEEGEGE